MSEQQLQLSSGETFYEPRDWLAFMRDAAKGFMGYTLGRNPKYDYMGPDCLIPMLYDELKRTALGQSMAEATMTLLERGIAEEVKGARSGPFQHATDAPERIARLFRPEDRARIDSAAYALLDALLAAKPEDVRTIDLALREHHASPKDQYVELVAKHSPHWFARNVPPLTPQSRPYVWVASTDGDDRILVLQALVERNAVTRTIEHIIDSRTTDVSREIGRALFKGHPVFERAIEEALRKPR